MSAERFSISRDVGCKKEEKESSFYRHTSGSNTIGYESSAPSLQSSVRSTGYSSRVNSFG